MDNAAPDQAGLPGQCKNNNLPLSPDDSEACPSQKSGINAEARSDGAEPPSSNIIRNPPSLKLRVRPMDSTTEPAPKRPRLILRNSGHQRSHAVNHIASVADADAAAITFNASESNDSDGTYMPAIPPDQTDLGNAATGESDDQLPEIAAPEATRQEMLKQIIRAIIKLDPKKPILILVDSTRSSTSVERYLVEDARLFSASEMRIVKDTDRDEHKKRRYIREFRASAYGVRVLITSHGEFTCGIGFDTFGEWYRHANQPWGIWYSTDPRSARWKGQLAGRFQVALTRVGGYQFQRPEADFKFNFILDLDDPDDMDLCREVVPDLKTTLRKYPNPRLERIRRLMEESLKLADSEEDEEPSCPWRRYGIRLGQD